jgi:hypothetical protein
MNQIVRLLLELQNRDGGWPSQPARSSNTEATSLAVLALDRLDHADAEHARGGGQRWLADRQRPDGSWTFSDPVPEASWSTAIATLALVDRERARSRRAAAWLLTQEGRTLGWRISLLHRFLPGVLPVRLDPDLKGWAWRSGAAGFVEPTAHALIALKRLRPHTDTRAEARIAEAETLLYDRMCPDGGWNYGNSVVLGVDLPPYADVTALALIALQDHCTSARNVASLAVLRRMIDGIDSTLGLAWATLCLSLYGEETGELRRRLQLRYRQRSLLVDTRSLALTLLALSGSEPFRL